MRAGKVKNKKDDGVTPVESPERVATKMTANMEMEMQGSRNSPEKGEHRNKTKIAAAIQI